MRYFLVTVSIHDDKPRGHLSAAIQSELFPSATDTCATISAKTGAKLHDLCIVNIMEFKNKEDYESYQN